MFTYQDRRAIKRWLQNPNWWFKREGVRLWLDGWEVIAVRYTRAGFPLDLVRVPVADLDWSTLRPVIEGEVGTLLKKRAERRIHGEDRATTQADEWAVLHPVLWQHLTETRWEDGSSREPSSLLVFFQDGQLKGMLRDKSEGLCLWATARNLTELLSVLETQASDPETEWREDRQQPGQKARRRPGGGGR